MRMINRSNILNIFFFIILILLLVITFFMFKPFFNSVMWAIILTLVFFPVHKWLTKVLRGRNTLSALIMTLIALVIVIIPCFLFFLTLITQGIEFYSHASQYIRGPEFSDLIAAYQDQGKMQIIQDKLTPLGISIQNVRDFLLNSINIVGNFLFSQTKAMIINVFAFFVTVLFTIFTFFFLLRDGEKTFAELKEILPLKTEDKDYIFKTLYNTTRGVVLGMAASGILVGGALIIGYSIVGVPYAFFWGILSIILAFLPIIGPGLIYVPLSLYSMAYIGFGKGLFLLMYGLVWGNLVDYLIRPYFISETAKIPILLLFFAVLGGLHFFGIIGVFLGPLLIATLLSFIRIYRKEFVAEEK
ncbi:MAG: AI-2E family transporter [Candidatus Ancaeobacter aquaticus]|nr:AI-2E family transporter [Candidatus Ancaeobacter aquaticus]